MPTVLYESQTKRKNNMPLLGEGCKTCSVRSKCCSEHCTRVQRYKHSDCTDLLSDYLCFRNRLGLETYVRHYRHSYLLIVKGEVYASGEKEDTWHVHLYDRNRKRHNYCISHFNERALQKRFGTLCLDAKYGDRSEVPRWIPLEDSDFILLY